ncbi:MAG: Mur ligase family protein, partial [Candidatus Carbobacillus sp.]|nr:Mur ligase family protein [Candidatus Carbobacillus sp.]
MAIDDWMYASYMRAHPFITGKNDAKTRHPELTSLLLERLGRPDVGIPAVVITGSKGKGSVAALTFFVLRAAGYRVGLFTSPHLLNVRERIRVDGRAISEKDFVRLSNVVKKAASDVPEKPEAGRYLGPVGLALALAYLYFKEKAIDVAVIESGRGGRFDESSVIDHKVAVITSIFPEHLEALGPTLRDIVWHKTGIITPSVQTVIIGQQTEAVMTYIKAFRDADRAFPRWMIFGEDIKAEVLALDITGTKARLGRCYHPLDPSA